MSARSSITGRFVSAAYALRHGDTTVTERERDDLARRLRIATIVAEYHSEWSAPAGCVLRALQGVNDPVLLGVPLDAHDADRISRIAAQQPEGTA
jgi:hypothetical protein